MANKNDYSTLTPLIKSAPKILDLTNQAHLEQVIETVEKILLLFNSKRALAQLERDLFSQTDMPMLISLALKIAKSKIIVADIKERLHISVVFAVYKEHNRIKTRAEHEHGENFLLRKIAQLQWLLKDSPNLTWDMIIVDGGCPEYSGKIAQEILDKNYDGHNVQILFVEEAIKQRLPVIAPMTSIAESQKGGAIEYGMWVAAQQHKPNHVILFTDADLSTHLGQIGLLLDGLINHNKQASIGSRRSEMSVVVRPPGRNFRGKLFIYLRKRLLPDLNYILDTQCGFKAFKANTVRAIILNMLDKKFGFDSELLLKIELNQPNAISQVPIAWIDSDAASTTTDQQPYLTMLKSMAEMYRKYLPSNPESGDFAQFIDSLNEAAWRRLVDNVPQDIATRTSAEFSHYNGINVSDLKAITQTTIFS